jgi:hypothetical protein
MTTCDERRTAMLTGILDSLVSVVANLLNVLV